MPRRSFFVRQCIKLDEAVLTVQLALTDGKFNIPWCAFNGGNDAFVDVGNKKVGVEGLMQFLKIPPASTLHVGDQFFSNGNDFACRQACPTVWITNPSETSYILQEIVSMRVPSDGFEALKSPRIVSRFGVDQDDGCKLASGSCAGDDGRKRLKLN